MTPHDSPVAQAADSWQEALEVLDILEERQEGNGKQKTRHTMLQLNGFWNLLVKYGRNIKTP